MRFYLPDVVLPEPCASSSNREAIEVFQRVFKNAGAQKFGEYRWLNVGLAVGGSVAAAWDAKFAGAVRPEPSRASQPSPLAGALFWSLRRIECTLNEE
jgi:hypothetical protein